MRHHRSPVSLAQEALHLPLGLLQAGITPAIRHRTLLHRHLLQAMALHLDHLLQPALASLKVLAGIHLLQARHHHPIIAATALPLAPLQVAQAATVPPLVPLPQAVQEATVPHQALLPPKIPPTAASQVPNGAKS